MRHFETGATRDVDDSKYDYEGFISPRVLQEFGAYMHRHRLQADGQLRDSDNWQKGFGEEHLAVCMKSLWRHFMDLWLIHRGSKDKARETLGDALCGILFNTMAYYHWVIEHDSDEEAASMS